MLFMFDYITVFLSVVFLIISILVFGIIPYFKKENKWSWDKCITVTIATLFLSIFSLHLFIYTCNGMSLETILDAFLVSVKTFLADGGITIKWHFKEIDDALSIIYNGEHAIWFEIGIKAVAAIGDIAAPLLTLTTVISILSELFPKIKILCSIFRDKFVFSSINEETVVLAESVHRHYNDAFFKPMLIVTNIYANNESKMNAEILERFKKIGCVCIKDDLFSLSVRARTGGKITYILSDEDKMKNLSVALELTKRYNSTNSKALKYRNYIYVFTDQDEAEEFLSKECKSLMMKINSLKYEKNHYFLPMVIPIKEYKNSIYDLFDRIPLYTPIIGKNRKELNITILGTGKIGTEAFLAAFWCCQMLDTKLNITVLSLDAAVRFKNELNRISENIIKATKCEVPYCGISLISCDLKQISFDDLLNTPISSDNKDYQIETYGDVCKSLYKTDYYIVSLGNDELNVNTAYLLRRSVERAVLEGKREKDNQVIIATSIYDSSIESVVAHKDNDVRIVPFASFESRFSYQNVINKRFITGAQKISDTYDAMSTSYCESDMKEIYGKVGKAYSHYKYWANVARRLHNKYAMFSVGICTEEEIDNYIKKLRDDDLCDRLAWLEHRRWNAHLWTMGYKCYETTKNFTEKKAHPCLVETKPGRHHRLPFKLKKEIDPDTHEEKSIRVCELGYEQLKVPPYDALDAVSCQYGYECDLKLYDYPQYSNICLTDEQMVLYLNPDAKDYYSSKINVDEYTYELYEARQDEAGQRVWTIYRFLLDEELKQDIVSLCAKNEEAIADYLINSYKVDKTNLMAWQQVMRELDQK